MTGENIKLRIRNLLSNGSIKQALIELSKYDEAAAILQVQYVKLERENGMGILRRDDYVTERNRIIMSALNHTNAINPAQNNDLERIIELLKLNTDQLQKIDESIHKAAFYTKGKLDELFKNIDQIDRKIFDTSSEQALFFEKLENAIAPIKEEFKVRNELLEDKELKDKLKLSLSLYFIRWERELSIDNLTFPKSWKELKKLFIN